jgi:chaperonin cofactor prefoldin
MLKKIQERTFPFLIAFSALSVSASAAFYSVSGLSKLFAGAAFAVIIMASSLEVAKLVIASLLYQYRKTLPKVLKIYLTIACGILILITSMGIYGFLSAAYQETANKAGTVDAQVALVETKRDNVQKQLSVYNVEKENTDKAIADLRKGLSNNVVTYTNAQGQLIQSTSSATRKALEKQLDQAIVRQTELNGKVDELNTQLFDYESEIVEIKTGNDLAGELGPLKYLSGLTGVAMDKIINVLLLIIIFVFDPLAIALVIAANYAFSQLRKKDHPLEEQVEDMRKVVDAYDDLQEEIKEWDSTLMDGLEDDYYDSIEWDEYGNPSPIIENDYDLEDIENQFKQEKIKEAKSASVSGWRKRKQIKELEEQDPFDIYKKQFDTNNDGILDQEEMARFNYWKMLQDRKNKDNNDKQITY